MTERRLIIELGTGNDQYGMDYTKACARAVEDAIRHSSLPIFQAIDLSHEHMNVHVTVGVQDPSAVDIDVVRKGLPRGQVHINVVHGGLNVTNPDTNNTIVIATAAVEAFLPAQTGWRIRR